MIISNVLDFGVKYFVSACIALAVVFSPSFGFGAEKEPVSKVETAETLLGKLEAACSKTNGSDEACDSMIDEAQKAGVDGGDVLDRILAGNAESLPENQD